MNKYKPTPRDFVMADIWMYVDAIHYTAERLGFTKLKSLKYVVLAIATGRDVFGVLPTDYGKSQCYTYLPLMFDCLRKTQEEEPSIVSYCGFSSNRYN